MGFMQTESVLQSKNRSGPAKNRFSVALDFRIFTSKFTGFFDHYFKPCDILGSSLVW